MSTPVGGTIGGGGLGGGGGGSVARQSHANRAFPSWGRPELQCGQQTALKRAHAWSQLADQAHGERKVAAAATAPSKAEHPRADRLSNVDRGALIRGDSRRVGGGRRGGRSVAPGMGGGGEGRGGKGKGGKHRGSPQRLAQSDLPFTGCCGAASTAATAVGALRTLPGGLAVSKQS